MYLLDTVVLSELRKHRANSNVLRWAEEKHPLGFFLSTITVGELERGVERQRSINPAFAERLSAWLDQLLGTYEQRILPVDTAIARRWGRLTTRMGHAGADLLIAATALEHGLTVATRNVRHFVPTGVAVENPFEGAR